MMQKLKFPVLCSLLLILIVGVYADLARQPSTELGLTDLPIVKADDLPCIDDPLEAWSESELIIWQYNTTHYACRNMSTLAVHELADNLTRVEENALGNMTTGQLYLKEIGHNTSLTLTATQNIFEQYNGVFKYWNSTGSYLFGSGGSSPPGGNYTLAPSYIIFKSGTTYYAESSQGNIDYSSTTFSTVTNNVFGVALRNSGGWVHFKAGNYTATAPTIIYGKGRPADGTTTGPAYVVTGEGATRMGTCFVAAANTDVFQLKNSTVVNMHDMSFYMPTTNSGEAITGNWEDTVTGQKNFSCRASQFHELDFWGGSAGKYMINLNDTWGCSYANLQIETWGAGGIKIAAYHTQYNEGDSSFSGCIYTTLQADNGVGWYFLGSNVDGKRANLFRGVGSFYFRGASGTTGGIGIKCEHAAWIDITGIQFDDTLAYGIYGIEMLITRWSGYMWNTFPNGATVFYCDSSSAGNIFENWYIYVSGGESLTFCNDAGSSSDAPNSFKHLIKGGSGTLTRTNNTYTVFRDMYGTGW